MNPSEERKCSPVLMILGGTTELGELVGVTTGVTDFEEVLVTDLLGTVADLETGVTVTVFVIVVGGVGSVIGVYPNAVGMVAKILDLTPVERDQIVARTSNPRKAWAMRLVLRTSPRPAPLVVPNSHLRVYCTPMVRGYRYVLQIFLNFSSGGIGTASAYWVNSMTKERFSRPRERVGRAWQAHSLMHYSLKVFGSVLSLFLCARAARHRSRWLRGWHA